MFCYCFVSIFAAVPALTFFFHPPFSSHVLTDKCGLTETIPRARYCCLQQHCLVQFIRKQLDCWKGSMHTQYMFHPTVPAATQQSTVPHLIVWELHGWRFGAGMWTHSFQALLLPFCRVGQGKLSLYLKRTGMACKASLGKGHNSWHPGL